jgi:hypothetical protein
MVLSRRQFLTQLAAISGMGAAFSSMQALGLASTPYNLGPWVYWTESGSDVDAYRLLNRPEGRIDFSRSIPKRGHYFSGGFQRRIGWRAA